MPGAQRWQCQDVQLAFNGYDLLNQISEFRRGTLSDARTALLNSIKKTTADRALSYLRKQRSAFLARLAVRGTHRFWQAGGGWDENVVEAGRVLAIIEYIHNNPVTRGLALRPEDWLWSSARAWLTGRDEPVAIDRTIPFGFELPGFASSRG